MSRVKEYPNPGFANRLNDAIYEAGITKSELAKKIGMDRKVIYAYTNCVCYPSVGTFAKICMVLNVSADYLIFGKENKNG